MKKNEELEEILMNKTSMDDLIKMKIETEFRQEQQEAKEKIQPKIVTEIKDVPSDVIFSSKSVFRVFNRINKTETLINGIQAEAMLGLQDNIRLKILNGEMSTFATDDIYIKFEKACLNS